MTDFKTDEPNLQSLREAWTAAFGTAPDKYLSRRLMAKALAWHQQCEGAGGFPAPLKRRLPVPTPASAATCRPPWTGSAEQRRTSAHPPG
ncbi:DUF2924 domain-containing protein [Alphaproteobacteria bacterium GH1-50]|uniref:DUF2924 domain-containing protein n=1 Tax=Kangsaoukella pontilimi TaxID=2691042 RepID=A0A7C9MSS2_9RHOB|nr:DUF2924 domain-containing protein [Kangsaoukella pontilimi]